jgi:uncharacterized protein YndB with AHSA1/START domain
MSEITISTTVKAPITNTWNCYTKSEYVTKWNFADPSWCCPIAESDLRVGGRFTSRMEAKDGSVGFNFGGIYTEVIVHKLIKYTMVDAGEEPSDADRTAEVTFETTFNNETIVTVIFDAETQNPVEMQKAGWQSILNNFAVYTEQQYQEEVAMMSANMVTMITGMI